MDRTCINDVVWVDRGEYNQLIKSEERILAVQRMYLTGECYSLDTVLAVLGIKEPDCNVLDLQLKTCEPCEDTTVGDKSP